MKITLSDIRRAGGPRTDVHGPFKAEGIDVRNAFGVIVGRAIDERHAVMFAASHDMLEVLEELAFNRRHLDLHPADRAMIEAAIAKAKGGAA